MPSIIQAVRELNRDAHLFISAPGLIPIIHIALLNNDAKCQAACYIYLIVFF